MQQAEPRALGPSATRGVGLFDPFGWWSAWTTAWSQPATPPGLHDARAHGADAPAAPWAAWPTGAWQDWFDYWIDASQRTVLWWDVMRQRGNAFLEHAAAGKPPVLKFESEMVLDGRTLPRPVNYFLLQIVPPAGTVVDTAKRPFVVIDPRAGHGPGIGGFKPSSEIGVAMKAGHPCYFVGFRPEPVPGQTLRDVAVAEAEFLRTVAARHPRADAKPCVIGNCQAGWAVMMLSAAAPEVTGPIIIAGAPLSYWSGSGIQNPMRYTGGLLGGSWPALLASDLGNGRFDGAHIVSNFEQLDPANALWTKRYNLWANIDTEPERFLDFELWWGGYFLLNAEEIEFIVDELFVGNKLVGGGLVTRDGRPIDLRNIRSPIVVFASRGDNITPPQQALNWILDSYATDEEILARTQTIVYLLHEDIGHLGIFVSGRIAVREHTEMVQTLDMIETLPPGLYEMIIEDKQPDTPHAELVPGRYLVRFERRRLADLRALEDTREDERLFEVVARVSDMNAGLYRTFGQPWIRPLVTEETAEALRRLHPNRVQHYMVSDLNPLMRPLGALAETVRQHRRPVSDDNPYVGIQRAMAEQIETALNGWRDVRDGWYQTLFEAIYGWPWLQALVGSRSADAKVPARGARDDGREAFVRGEIAALRARIGEGGPPEALLRTILYAVRGEGVADFRGFRMAQEIRKEAGGERIPPAVARDTVRDQTFMLLLDEERALAALPMMVPREEDRRNVLDKAQRLLGATGDPSPSRRERLARVEKLFGLREAS